MFVIFLLTIFGQCDAAGQPELEIRPAGDRFIRALDSNIVFTCYVGHIGVQLVDIQLQWFNEHGVEIVDVAAPGRRMYVEEDGPSTKKLYIHVAEEHAGSYTCTGVLEGNRQSKTVRLDLFKDITYDIAPSPQHPVQHENGQIQCQVSGQPIPTVSWRYRGRRIHTGGRYTQNMYGLLIQNITTADDGIYYCRAEVDAEGRYNERAIEVIVYIPPTIVPNSSHKFEGEQAQESSIRCSARGKPDPKYTFFKDSNEAAVHSTDRIQVDGDSGTIHFRPQHKADEGRYRCVAFNDAGETETFLDLTVVVPPTVYNLKNVTQAEGRNVKLVCLSYGDPPPTMSFQKANSSEPYHMGENEGGRIVMRNPSGGRLELLVKNLVPSDMSNYTCLSANKAGFHEKNGTITVNFKPRFPPDHITEVYIWPGKTRNITCHIHAEPLPAIEWLHHGRALVNNETYRIYKMSKDSNLQVTVREPDQGWIFGDYVCLARNNYGTGEQNIALRRASLPEAPNAVSVRYKSSTIITLDVEPPVDDGGVPIIAYRVYYDQGKVLEFQTDEDILIEHLDPTTSYVFQIRAVNEVGEGLVKQVIVTTDDVRVPSPLVITSDPFGKSAYEFVVSWKKPETGGMPIVEYRFRLRKIKGPPGVRGPEPLSDWFLRERDENPDSQTVHYVLRNLDPQTWYQLEVTALNNIGWSQPNDLFCFRTTDASSPQVGPIGQNKGHAKHLVSFLTTLSTVAVCIVFSQH